MRKGLAAVAVMGVLAATVGVARDAHAWGCGAGEIDIYTPERVLVANADWLLRQGKVQEAAWLIQKTWPYMSQAVPGRGSLPHIADAVRIMAQAAVRSDGNVRTGFGFASRTPTERWVTVEWGVKRLRMLAAADPESDAAKTNLGEALARFPARQDEGKAILEDLAKRNAMTSAEGYAALAFLRAEGGDAGSAKVAAETCTRWASNADVQCHLSPSTVRPLVASR
jgi:hypothetical protein